MISRRSFLTVATTTGTALVAGCGHATTRSSRGAADTLRIGQFWPPASLDPAKAGGESLLYLAPAYDPLIYRAPDGSLQPRLATLWKYVGSGNEAFDITLRQGVTFSDGSPLTAETVKANIEYFRTAAGQAAAFLAPISSVTVVDGQTVRVALSRPHPHLPTVFTQDFLAGNVISPAVMAQPGRLASETFGTGPYVLSVGETVANDHYTYVPNPRYWNARAVHYKKVVMKVLPNENTALAALKTGQVDVISGSYAIVDGAKSAGLRVKSSPNIVAGIQLNDRAGTLSAPLADVRVRQALNVAVNRERITKALLGDYGIPTEQPAAPGQDGYNDTNFYRYDPAKARKLLAEAGHSNGFTLPVLIPSVPAFPGQIVQAIAADLEQVDVKLKITAMEPASAMMEIAKFPASSMGWGVLPVYFMGRGLWLRDAIGMNPFRSSDPVLEDLDRQAARADETTRPELDRRIVRRVVEQGWFLPVCLTPIFLFHRSTVAIDSQPGKALPGLDSWRPAP